MKIRVAHGARAARGDDLGLGPRSLSSRDKLQPLTDVPAQLQDLQIMGDSLCDEASLAEQGVQNLDKLELVGGGSSSVGSARPPVRAELRPSRAHPSPTLGAHGDLRLRLSVPLPLPLTCRCPCP